MGNPKCRYIEATYELLKRDGIDAISIRKVASEMGCTSAALYKHFSDINELVGVASVRFLHDYARDARVLSRVDLNPLELNLQLWECFAFYSFKDAPIFENLFYGGESQGALVKNHVAEYYVCFPEDYVDLKDFMQDMFRGSTLMERNSILLNRATEQGMLTQQAADYLCKVDTYVYRAMLASIRETYKDPDVFRKALREFMDIVIAGYKNMLNPGYSILVVEPFDPTLKMDTQVDEPRMYQVVIPMKAAEGAGGTKGRRLRNSG